MRIPTTKVTHKKNGYTIIINETDFDARIHKIYAPEPVIEKTIKQPKKKTVSKPRKKKGAK